MTDYPPDWAGSLDLGGPQGDQPPDVDIRVEYQLQGLVVARDDPDDAATWEPWGTFTDLDDPFARDRLAFLKDRTRAARAGGPQPPMRILAHRVMRREITTSPWAEVPARGGD